MTTAKGAIRENHVVEFDEGRRIAWMPAEAGKRPLGRGCAPLRARVSTPIVSF